MWFMEFCLMCDVMWFMEFCLICDVLHFNHITEVKYCFNIIVLEFIWKKTILTFESFSHCFSYSRGIQPRGGLGSFFTPRLPRRSFTLCPSAYFLGPYFMGFRTHVSHYNQTPGQPRCIFWLAEVMDELTGSTQSQYEMRTLTYSYL